MAQNKALPYLIFGVPILIGGYFIYKSLRKPKKDDVVTPPTSDGGGTSGSGTSGSGTSSGGVYTPKQSLPFKKGSSGDYVKSIQSKLGISADGKFGNQTDASVRAFQKSKGLVVDGIVGQKTWRALFSADFPSTGVASGTFSSAKPAPTTLNKYATTKFSTDPNYWS